MKKSVSLFFIAITTAAIVSGCIANDIPFAICEPKVKTVESSDAVSVSVDNSARSILLELLEEADICAVNIGKIVLADSVSARMDPVISGKYDLSEPLQFTLSTHQDYIWTILAAQKINRSFSIKNQVGTSVFDQQNRRIIAKVPMTEPLSGLTVLECRMGPQSTTRCSVDVTSLHDFTSPVEIEVTMHGRKSIWTICVEKTDAFVDFTELSPWTRVIWMRANGMAGQKCGFMWRKHGDSQWNDLPAQQQEAGAFSSCLESVEPDTEYDCVAYCGNTLSAEKTVRTDIEAQLPNSGFEIFSHAESDDYFSFYDKNVKECSTKWWDSGNSGSTMVGKDGVICSPDTEDFREGAASSKMKSRYVVVKFAAGNMFSGSFAGLVGVSGGMVDFGRPFTLRPRSMKLSLKYIGGEIDHIGTTPKGTDLKLGDPDRCSIFIALGDWDPRTYGGSAESPVRVNTTKAETFIDPNAEAVIAYGSFETDSSTQGWTDIEIPLDYRTSSRVPTHIIISCASSKWGDYFTGSTKSTLWVDAIKLVY